MALHTLTESYQAVQCGSWRRYCTKGPELSTQKKKKLLYSSSTIILVYVHLSFHTYFSGCSHCRTLLGYSDSEMCIVGFTWLLTIVGFTWLLTIAACWIRSLTSFFFPIHQLEN